MSSGAQTEEDKLLLYILCAHLFLPLLSYSDQSINTIPYSGGYDTFSNDRIPGWDQEATHDVITCMFDWIAS